MTAPPAAQAPGRAYARYALILLALGNLLNYLDRNIIFALFEPIKLDLGVTDTQLGWLGSAYAIVFSVGALFSGVLSDLVSRRAVLAGGVALWTAGTALGGIILRYWQLLATRALVGVGQSSYLPAAQALLADYFPLQGRAQAMGIFWGGLAVGGALAVYLGGILAAAFGWRVALIVVGLPGLVFALLLAKLKDPAERPDEPLTPRRAGRLRFDVRTVARLAMPLLVSQVLALLVAGSFALFEDLPAAADTLAYGVIAGLGLVWAVVVWVREALRATGVGQPQDVVDEMFDAALLVLRTPTLIWLFVGGALTSAAMNTLVAWSASYLQRELGMSLVVAARTIGPLGIVAGVLGSWAGGRLGDSLFERFPSGRVLAGAAGFLIGAPACVVMLLVTDASMFAPLFFVTVFFYMWYNGPVAAVLFDVVPRGIAATVMGAYIFFIHIAGDAIALPAVGALSDRIGLRGALLSLPLVGLLGGVVLLFAVFTVRRDMARAKSAPARLIRPVRP
jgi:predicted MFS family arabinose efflux permease